MPLRLGHKDTVTSSLLSFGSFALGEANYHIMRPPRQSYGKVLRTEASCQQPTETYQTHKSKVSGQVLWLEEASSHILQLGGARDCVLRSGRVPVWVPSSGWAAGYALQSTLVHRLSSLPVQGHRLCSAIRAGHRLGSSAGRGSRLGSMAWQDHRLISEPT